MATIQIIYDLNAPGRDYSKLIERIKQLGGGGWCRALESTWFILTSATPAAVRDDLLNYIDQSSKLLVLDVSGDSGAWFGLSEEVSKWLRSNL